VERKAKMSKLDSQTFSEASLPQLEIFNMPPTQTSVERIYYQDFRPVSQLNASSSDTPIEFAIGAAGGDYTDLSRTRLYVRGKIVNADGSDLAADKKVGPVQQLLASLFSQVDVTVGDKLVSVSNNTYAYTAYLQTLFGYGSGAKQGPLGSQLWSTDRGANVDSGDPFSTAGNEGLNKRTEITKGSATFDMTGPIFESVFEISKYLLNGVEISLKFFRNRPAFYLMSEEENPNFKFVFEDIIVRVCRVCVSNAVLLAHTNALTKAPARYNFKRSYVKMTTIASGHMNFVWDNVYNSFAPTKIVIGFASSVAVGGNYLLNPFRFPQSRVSSISLYVDGQSVPGKAIRISDGEYVGAYANLFDAFGKWGAATDIDIGRSEFLSSYALYAFEIEPLSNEDYLPLLKTANVRLETTFSQALIGATNCVIYSEFPAFLEINKSRAVYLHTAT
jgi:hypothetical protein